MKKLLFFCFFLLFLLPLAFALEIPKYSGYVNDYANIISPDWQFKINNLISEIEKNTTVEIAIVTIPSLEGEDLEDFTINLANSWGVGKKEKNNGLVFLASMKERRNRFEIGKGIEGTITDIMSDDLRREYITPYFRSQRYGEGIYLMLEEFYRILQNDPEAVSRYSAQKSSIRKFEGLFVIAFIIYFLALFSFASKKENKYFYLIPGDILGLSASFLISSGIFLFSLFLIFWLFVFSTKKIHMHGPFGLGGYGRGGFSGGGFGGGGFSGGGSSGGW